MRDIAFTGARRGGDDGAVGRLDVVGGDGGGDGAVSQLVRYDAMCRAIAEAHAVDEVKDIRDKARAIEMSARQAQNTEAERKACEIRLRAERKCGELLREQLAHGCDRRSVSRSHGR